MTLYRPIISLLVLLVISGCGSEQDKVQVNNSGPAQGTFYHVSYVVEQGIDYRQSIDSILFVIDRSMSLWDEGSAISRLNRGDTLVMDVLFQHLSNVLKTAIAVSKKTDGAFDVSIAPLANYLGFGPDKIGSVDSSVVDSLSQYVDFNRIHTILDSGFLPIGMQIDLNAIAQGYSVDVICSFLESKGIKNYLVEVGGEIRGLGKNIDERTWVVGIDKPKEKLDKENRYQVILNLDGQGLATSGNYRKFWLDEETGMKYVHTINPKTGFPVKSNLLSATVVSADAMTADAWATACMVAGVDKAKEWIMKNNLDAYLIYTSIDGKWETWQTEGFRKITL